MPPQKNSDSPKLDMKIPFYFLIASLMTVSAAYFGQKEATSIALTEIKGDVKGVQQSLSRIETDRYTASDARRDFAWRDERTIEQSKRLADLETSRRR